MLTVSPASYQWVMSNRQVKMRGEKEAIFVITHSLLTAMVPGIASC